MAQNEFWQGNKAIAMGAIAAGCRYFGGYPITPSTEIMEVMSEELPKLGGKFVQMEDEIGGIASALGASIAGKKSDDGEFRPWNLAQAGASWIRLHRGNPARSRRRTARRPLDRTSDEGFRRPT